MGDNLTRNEIDKELAKLQAQNPAAQQQTWNPDSLFADEPIALETAGVEQAPVSQTGSFLNSPPLGHGNADYNNLQLLLNSIDGPSLSEPNTHLAQMWNNIPTQNGGESPSNPNMATVGTESSNAALTDLLEQLLGPVDPSNTANFPKNLSAPTLQWDGSSEPNRNQVDTANEDKPLASDRIQRNLDAIQGAADVQQLLLSPTPSLNLDSIFSQWNSVPAQDENQIGISNIGTLPVLNADNVELAAVQQAPRMQQTPPTTHGQLLSSNPATESNGLTGRSTDPAGTDGESILGLLGGFPMLSSSFQNRFNPQLISEVVQQQEHNEPTSVTGDSRIVRGSEDPHSAPNQQAGNSETQHKFRAGTAERSSPVKQNTAPKEKGDSETSGSLEICLSVSDDESDDDPSESFQHGYPYQTSWAPEHSKGAPNSPSDSPQNRRLHENAQVGQASESQQKARSSNMEKSSAVGGRSGTRSVRFISPPRLSTERVGRSSLSWRRPTPKASRSVTRDIRDRYNDVQEEIKRTEEKEKVKRPLLSMEYVEGLNFEHSVLPDIEEELCAERNQLASPTITLELGQEHTVSRVIQSLRCHSRSKTSVDLKSGCEVLVVPDDEMFRVLYSVVKKVILHRLEGNIASFISHLLNKSISLNVAGHFCKNFIMYMEKLSVPRSLKDFHNFVFEKVGDVDITWLQREIELHLGSRLDSLKPESMTTAFVKKLVAHRRMTEEVKDGVRRSREIAQEYRKKKKFLNQKDVQLHLTTIPRSADEVTQKKAEFRESTEQFAHEFSWYSRELFLHDEVQSHYLLARFMLSNMYNRKRGQILKDKVGTIGDVEKVEFLMEMEKYSCGLWTKLIKELRSLLLYADAAGLMDALCANINDNACKQILGQVNEEMNPQHGANETHAVLVPHYGNRIGTFCVRAFGKANDNMSFKKKRIQMREINFKRLNEAYELYKSAGG